MYLKRVMQEAQRHDMETLDPFHYDKMGVTP
jgi:hypothetical protein